jgi:hypothetical protein
MRMTDLSIAEFGLRIAELETPGKCDLMNPDPAIRSPQSAIASAAAAAEKWFL